MGTLFGLTALGISREDIMSEISIEFVRVTRISIYWECKIKKLLFGISNVFYSFSGTFQI